MNPALPERPWARRLVAIGTALYGFGLPFSSAAVSFGMAFLLAGLALQPRELARERPWRNPVMAVGLALFAYIALRTFAAGDWTSHAWEDANHYHELLLAPILLALWHNPAHRRTFLAAFIAGCLFTAAALWVSHASEPFFQYMQRRRISAGFALVVAAYLLVLRAPPGARKWPWLAAAAFFALTVMFAVDGRTGWLTLLILSACAAWVRTPERWRVFAAVGAPLALVLAAYYSPAVQSRLQEMDQAFRSAAPPAESNSTAIRIEILRITGVTVREHWPLGVGYSNYRVAHREAAQQLYATHPDRDARLAGSWARLENPHSEYVMQLVGGGVAGLALFIAWLLAALWQAARSRGFAAEALGGIVLAYGAGCLFNSMLLDYMEGHLFVAMLACLVATQRAPVRADEFQRILVVVTRQIGDVLLATPLIHAARRRWPQARIEVIGFAGTLGMLRGNPEIDGLVEIPPDRAGRLAVLWRAWRRYDLALVGDIGDRAHLLAWVAARTRTGVIPQQNPSNWWKRMLLHHVVVAAGDAGDRHVAVEKQELIAPWVDPLPQAKVQAAPGRALPAEVDSQLEPRFVVVHAPSMWSYKQWPVAHYARLVRSLLEGGHQVVLTGSAGARDQECIAPLRALGHAPKLLDVSGRLDLEQVTALLRRAALYVGPDTSVSHLAAAAGTPVLAVFGPTNPQRWAPWPANAQSQQVFVRAQLVQQAGNVTLVQSALPCVPCAREGCEHHRQSRSDCLDDISPERVIEEARRILA